MRACYADDVDTWGTADEAILRQLAKSVESPERELEETTQWLEVAWMVEAYKRKACGVVPSGKVCIGN